VVVGWWRPALRSQQNWGSVSQHGCRAKASQARSGRVWENDLRQQFKVILTCLDMIQRKD
jgi:hypothetical protein